MLFLQSNVIKKKYVKPYMFYARCLSKEKKRKPMSSSSSIYKNQINELSRLSKLNLSSLEEKIDKKGKETDEPSVGSPKRIVLTKNIEALPLNNKRRSMSH